MTFHFRLANLPQMTMKDSQEKKLNLIKKQSCYSALSSPQQEYIRRTIQLVPLTFQEIKMLVEFIMDFNMWGIEKWENMIPDASRWKENCQLKGTKFIEETKKIWMKLKTEEKDYSHFKPAEGDVNHKKIEFIKTNDSHIGLGECPVSSNKTRCCKLSTLDLFENCGFDCSYCCIQSFFHDDKVYFDDCIEEKLNHLQLDPRQIYHIGTGQSSDSLLFGNKFSLLETVISFVRKNPNVILELKSKSKNIDFLLENHIPRNVICTWTLNTQTIIENEEHLTADLEERLQAARQIADKKILVGFHFHPMVYYKNWQNEYEAIARKIQNNFSPDEVAMISFGTVTFIKKVIQKIRRRNIHSKILQMPMVESDGKLSYPDDIKIKLFSHMYQSFRPWHEKTFFYLCMENERLWMPVFNREYKSNDEFEHDMKDSYMRKIISNCGEN